MLVVCFVVLFVLLLLFCFVSVLCGGILLLSYSELYRMCLACACLCCVHVVVMLMCCMRLGLCCCPAWYCR